MSTKKKFSKTTITIEVIHNGNLEAHDKDLIQTENLLGYLVEHSIPSGDIVVTTTKLKTKSKQITHKQVEKVFGSTVEELVGK